MIKVAHVINTVAVGGAEAMLLKLVTHSDRRVLTHRVYTLLSPAGPLSGAMANLGIPVRELGMTRGLPNPARVFQLGRWLREDPPDLVQTWLYHADLVGGFAATLSRTHAPVVWNIQNGTLDESNSRRRTHWVVKICARTSTWLPDAIISCSHAAVGVHAALGYDTHKISVIPNGFDLSAFRPNAAARLALRQELTIPERAPVIGLVGRFDPQKDHETFMEAAGTLRAMVPDVHFVLCGRGCTRSNDQLMKWVDAAGVSSVCHLLGERTDIADVTAAFDIASSSSSYGEGFSNTIGEAMACGIPCVVTDVGDSAQIVGDAGRVVRPRSPEALCSQWADLLEMAPDRREKLGVLARERVLRNFSIGSVARSYEEVYRRVLRRRRHKMGGIPRMAPRAEEESDSIA